MSNDGISVSRDAKYLSDFYESMGVPEDASFEKKRDALESVIGEGIVTSSWGPVSQEQELFFMELELCMYKH